MPTELDMQRTRALDDVEYYAKRRKEADEQYARAVMHANDLGIRNVTIARKIGVSEACIRMFIKRRKDARG